MNNNLRYNGNNLVVVWTESQIILILPFQHTLLWPHLSNGHCKGSICSWTRKIKPYVLCTNFSWTPIFPKETLETAIAWNWSSWNQNKTIGIWPTSPIAVPLGSAHVHFLLVYPWKMKGGMGPCWRLWVTSRVSPVCLIFDNDPLA